MAYEVIHAFTDAQDQNKKYEVGDTYPKPVNKKIDQARLKELLSSNNKLGYPVIKKKEEAEERE